MGKLKTCFCRNLKPNLVTHFFGFQIEELMRNHILGEGEECGFCEQRECENESSKRVGFEKHEEPWLMQNHLLKDIPQQT